MLDVSFRKMLLFQALSCFLIQHQVPGEDATADVRDRVCDQMLSVLSTVLTLR